MNEGMVTSIAEMESLSLPDDLLDTYDDNCHIIEKTALDVLASSEIAVFNCLRNLSSQECVKILDRIHRKYVSDGDLVDYFVSLAVMTEYICTAYRNPHLYDTFLVAMGSKSEGMLFDKLCQRWLQVYRNHDLTNYVNSAQFAACFNILKYAAGRFPASFIPRNNLYNIVRTGEEVLHLFELRNSGTLAYHRPSSEKKKLTQPFTKDAQFGTPKSGQKNSANSAERNVPTSNSETKKRGWTFERGISQSPAANAGSTTITTHSGTKMQERNPVIPAPQIKPKSKGWMYERHVLQTPVTNTPVANSDISRSLETNTSISTPTISEKRKSKGWMFERVVSQTTPRSDDKSNPRISTPAKKLFPMVWAPVTNHVQTVSELTGQSQIIIRPNPGPMSIDTIDLTTSESPKKRALQDSILVNVGLKSTDVIESLEPPKKKFKNAFDVLMRRHKKKIFSSTGVLVA